ncbi:hypothetical protein K8I28_03780 [bacterium]|nr:hypothetical protein [bacterium]
MNKLVRQGILIVLLLLAINFAGCSVYGVALGNRMDRSMAKMSEIPIDSVNSKLKSGDRLLVRTFQGESFEGKFISVDRTNIYLKITVKQAIFSDTKSKSISKNEVFSLKKLAIPYHNKIICFLMGAGVDTYCLMSLYKYFNGLKGVGDP